MSRLNYASPNNPGIEYLSPSIYIQRPAVDVGHISAANLTAPNLILLISWTGAQSKHIAKYISGYNILFPCTPVMVITTSIYELVYLKSSKKRQSLFPAITTIASCPTFSTNILLHAFSEGGSYTSIQLAKAFLATTGRRLPISTFVFDSCPGNLHFRHLASAGRATAPHNLTAQILVSLTAYTVITSYYLTFLICNREEVLENLNTETKDGLNDPALWVVDVPRAYIYSKSDEFVDWRSILAHAQTAQRNGGPVFTLGLETSAHCAHIRQPRDAERYWNVTKTAWRARRSGGVVCAENELMKDRSGLVWG